MQLRVAVRYMRDVILLHCQIGEFGNDDLERQEPTILAVLTRLDASSSLRLVDMFPLCIPLFRSRVLLRSGKICTFSV